MQPCRYAFVATCVAVAAANNSLELVRDVALEDVPAGPRELHQRYSEIFRYGNRNAASHLWTSYILDRAAVTPAAQIELLFSGFCAVSGSPVYPSDYKRYRLRLKHAVTGVDEVGFMYYCCWPCVCDTWDFIKVDTLTVKTADGPKVYRFAVIGDPCVNEAQLDVPFVQPFDGRTTTQIRPIVAETHFLPRAHGSALFTRGETQTIATCTLGTKDAEQMIDGLNGLMEEFPGLITKVQGTGLLFSAELHPAIEVVGFDGIETWLRKNGLGVIHGGENSLRFTPHFAISRAEVAAIGSVAKPVTASSTVVNFRSRAICAAASWRLAK